MKASINALYLGHSNVMLHCRSWTGQQGECPMSIRMRCSVTKPLMPLAAAVLLALGVPGCGVGGGGAAAIPADDAGQCSQADAVLFARHQFQKDIGREAMRVCASQRQHGPQGADERSLVIAGPAPEHFALAGVCRRQRHFRDGGNHIGVGVQEEARTGVAAAPPDDQRRTTGQRQVPGQALGEGRQEALVGLPQVRLEPVIAGPALDKTCEFAFPAAQAGQTNGLPEKFQHLAIERGDRPLQIVGRRS